jgi:leucyl/phenylalanyl-tRNA--protein transferase
LLAIGGDLSPERLLAAYRAGVFPWYSEGQPILWFSPDPRMLLYPNRFKCSKSLERVLNSGRYTVRIDTNFERVISACAHTPRPGQEGTWITDDMIQAYIQLNRLGIAHSFECYRDGELVGGLYGLSLGAAFFGESMYHHSPDASKVAFAGLVTFAKRNSFHFIDAQTPTDHLRRLGAESIARQDFLSQLDKALESDSLIGDWSTYAS